MEPVRCNCQQGPMGRIAANSLSLGPIGLGPIGKLQLRGVPPSPPTGVLRQPCDFSSLFITLALVTKSQELSSKRRLKQGSWFQGFGFWGVLNGTTP